MVTLHLHWREGGGGRVVSKGARLKEVSDQRCQTRIGGVGSTATVFTICLVSGYIINGDQEGQR